MTRASLYLDQKLMELLHELSGGRRLPAELDALALALTRCELFSGRRADVLRLHDRVRELTGTV